MHLGNLAFWLNDALPFRLTPAYALSRRRAGLVGHADVWAPTAGNATPTPEFGESHAPPGETVGRLRGHFHGLSKPLPWSACPCCVHAWCPSCVGSVSEFY